MKILPLVAVAVCLAGSAACLAQSDVVCGQTLDAALAQGASLTVHSLSSEVVIVGTDREGLHVSCSAHDEEDARRIHLRVSSTASQTRLSIAGSGVKQGNVRIRIEVPHRANLSVHIPAGEIKVNEVLGDKDLTLRAGQITISAHAWDYQKVDVSVGVGEVNAKIYGADKGGFFRSFSKQNASGKYRLYARVTTGQIDLIGDTPALKTQ